MTQDNEQRTTDNGQRTNRLRWGILGVARINDRLLPAFARAANADLRALASRSLDKARAAAAAAGLATAYGSYEALLDDPAIDAVYNPLPNSLHAEWTMKAAERGKHVLCEKPLAPTAAEARRVVEFCRARGVTLMDGFMWPHHPRTARLRQFLDGGGLGEVRRVSGAFTFRLDRLDPSNIRLRPELGGGSLLDVGCYPVFGIRWAFAAEPVRAYATAAYRHGVDVEMSGLLWLADGRVGAFDCGFTLPFRGWLEVTGTAGVVRVPDMWLPAPRAAFTVEREGRPAEEVVVEGADQIVHMLEDFGRAVLHGQPVQPPPEEAVRTLRVLDALARSAREGREVAVEP
jgi:predicted dehydrogenase